MDITALYESLPEVEHMTDEQISLLETIMSLDNPLDFDDGFATNEILDAIENALDRTEKEAPAIISFKELVLSIRAKRAEEMTFI